MPERKLESGWVITEFANIDDVVVDGRVDGDDWSVSWEDGEVEAEHQCTCALSYGCCGQRVSIPRDALDALLASVGLRIVPVEATRG